MKKSKTKVLVVDDEPAFTALLRANLERTGHYAVREENISQRALAAACAFQPDIVLLDVSMPDMDGGDVASQLKSDPKTKDVPIIFLTALVGSDESRAGGYMSGGHLFLSKPISVAEMIASIEKSTLHDSG